VGEDQCQRHGLKALPALPETVSRYIEEHAEMHKPATVKRRVSICGDGSCSPSTTSVCLNREQAKVLCNKATGLTKNVVTMKGAYFSGSYRNWIQSANLSNYRISWLGKGCWAEFVLSGIYNGSNHSKTLQGAASIFIGDGNKVLVHWVD